MYNITSKYIKIILSIIPTGLCFLPSCFPRLYINVPIGKIWSDAQTYCRSKYTDIAAVRNEKELALLTERIETDYYVWIGLHSGPEAWRWSLENPNYYGTGDAGFRMWAAGAPFLNETYCKVCVLMQSNGGWTDADCNNMSPFICLDGKKSHTEKRFHHCF